MSRLENKIALVLGGAKGIGLAISSRFAAEGATTWFTSRNAQDLQLARQQIGDRGHPLQAELEQPQALEQLMAQVDQQHGRLDVLVINAGMSEYATLESVSPEDFDRHFSLNVRSPLFALQAALPLLKPGASVVLIGSIAASIGTPGYGVYGATKAALRSFARSWTSELAARGIRINVVAPGPIDTAMFASVSDEMREAIVSRIPAGRMGKASEVANAALFLASDESSFIAGGELCVDGGMTQV
ncbi:oxidoreductase [Izhakiella australiensis]|uniref:Oxidoreductase n=1 Tax=Izhakiella australiensis TaxID=1926881 RepID=A0A1S8YHT8_9GAMM|nr:SDR family oxidoreductase [Izhakiella australiensis]OON38619.1 oxidoreductase [Izhakiella australiensis]